MDVIFQDGVCQGEVHLMCNNKHNFFVKNSEAKILIEMPPCNKMISQFDGPICNGIRFSVNTTRRTRKIK
jgi:hypothetical protein